MHVGAEIGLFDAQVQAGLPLTLLRSNHVLLIKLGLDSIRLW